MRIDVSHALKSLKDMKAKLTPAQIAQAQSRALNRTVEVARTGASREVRSIYAIPAGGLTKRLPIGKASRSEQRATISAEARPLPIMAFKPRQVRRGVSVIIMKGQRRVIKSAFIQTIPRSGKQGVYARGRYSSQGKLDQFQFRKKREVSTGPDLPIDQLRSVSLATTMGNRSVVERMRGHVEDTYPKRLTHELQRLADSSITTIR